MTAVPGGSSAWWERRALHEKATGPPTVSGQGWAPGSKFAGNLFSPCISFSGRIPVGYAVSSRLAVFKAPGNNLHRVRRDVGWGHSLPGSFDPTDLY